MEGERDRHEPGGEELWASAIPRPRANWKSVARTNTVAVCCSVLQCVAVYCSGRQTHHILTGGIVSNAMGWLRLVGSIKL